MCAGSRKPPRRKRARAGAAISKKKGKRKMAETGRACPIFFYFFFFCGVDGQLFGGSNKQEKGMRRKRRTNPNVLGGSCRHRLSSQYRVGGRLRGGVASAGHVMPGRSDAATPLTA